MSPCSCHALSRRLSRMQMVSTVKDRQEQAANGIGATAAADALSRGLSHLQMTST